MTSPHALLQPYRPSADDPFDAVKAAHLLNRAGFGGTSEEIRKVMELGPDGAADWLLDFPDKPAEEQEPRDVPNLAVIQGLPSSFRELRKSFAGKNQEQRQALRKQLQMANREAVGLTIGWWLKRMAHGAHPLQEKLTLFWHGHFTTSAKDERSAGFMWDQNELLRGMSAGNFAQFVAAISRDPAMLDYLNNAQNRKDHPNENYARELMELFTLGIGNYTENDVKEAARAFTGWTHEGDEFVFRKQSHDTGRKTFLGRTGNFDGDDVVAILMNHPACPRYIAGKLFRFFVYDDTADDGLAESLGDLLKRSKFELRPLVRTILTSKAFYSAKAIGVQIKSPVQLVVGTIRMLGLQMPPLDALHGPLNQMGQVPLAPPNVKGWPGGHVWINANTLFVRYNVGVRLAAKADVSGPTTAPAGRAKIAGVVRAWVDRLIQRPVDEDKLRVLREAAGESPDQSSMRRMVQLIVSMPEYQLC